MKENIREQINLFKNFRPIGEAIKTDCQTKGAIYKTDISEKNINIDIKIPFNINLDKTEAKLLEDNIHNALELVLKPYFMKNL
jgi:hypothetical protein